jgi:hypothetical protein
MPRLSHTLYLSLFAHISHSLLTCFVLIIQLSLYPPEVSYFPVSICLTRFISVILHVYRSSTLLLSSLSLHVWLFISLSYCISAIIFTHAYPFTLRFLLSIFIILLLQLITTYLPAIPWEIGYHILLYFLIRRTPSLISSYSCIPIFYYFWL